MNEPYDIPPTVAFKVLDALRLAPIFVLKDCHREDLPEDFKPHKWDGFERDFAAQCHEAYQAMLTAMEESAEEKN